MRLSSLLLLAPLLTTVASLALPNPLPSSSNLLTFSEKDAITNSSDVIIIASSTSSNSPACHGKSKHYVYFVWPSSPNVTLFIDTPWYIRYQVSLARALRAAGFDTVSPEGANCNWIVVDTVSKAAVSRGVVGFRQTRNLDATDFEVPSEETVGRVRQVMQSTYPHVEIAMVCVFCLMPVWLPLLWCLGTLFLAPSGDWRKQWRQRRAARRVAVPLAPKVPSPASSVSGSGSGEKKFSF